VASICVDGGEFAVDDDGKLTRRIHAARMVNDQTTRTVPQVLATSGSESLILPTWDRTVFQYGNKVTADPVNGRFVTNEAGIYDVSLGHGDNGIANVNCDPDNVMIELTILIAGQRVAAERTERHQCATHFLNVSTGAIEIPNGATVRAEWTLTWQSGGPIAGFSATHDLLPSLRNMFSIFWIGPAV
jgi:hypothetical protein